MLSPKKLAASRRKLARASRKYTVHDNQIEENERRNKISHHIYVLALLYQIHHGAYMICLVCIHRYILYHSGRKYKELLNTNINTNRSSYFRPEWYTVCHQQRPPSISLQQHMTELIMKMHILLAFVYIRLVHVLGSC